MNIDDLEQRIKQHNIGAQKNSPDRVRYRTACTGCGKSAPFAPHGVRAQKLRTIVGNLVVCTTIWLARWRCRRCCRTFTDYPDFRLAV